MSINPLIKWTGGKRSELGILTPLIPSHQRIVEPFCGGAAVAFNQNPGSAVLNDVSKPLISFYETIKNDQSRKLFLATVENIDKARKEIKKSIKKATGSSVNAFFNAPSLTSQKNLLKKKFIKDWVKTFAVLSPEMEKVFLGDIENSVQDKIFKRIPKIEKDRGAAFNLQERREHLETALQAALYTTLRRIYNEEKVTSHFLSKNPSWRAASWYVVRNLCYSGMFRFSKNGAFNVPYGGISYNSRDFASAQSLNNKDVVDFLSHTDFSLLDFEDLFEKYNFFNPQTDFIFVDPPYDTEFSQYNPEKDFVAEDQKRLAKTLLKTKTPWMLVIKNTPFILDLYNFPHLSHAVFGKNYQVNFRNRHDRGVEHLIVTNYPLPPSSDVVLINPKKHFKKKK